jgi:hypothetical protein
MAGAAPARGTEEFKPAKTLIPVLFATFATFAKFGAA